MDDTGGKKIIEKKASSMFSSPEEKRTNPPWQTKMIAVDVDGVIFEAVPWQGVEFFGPVKQGAREALQELAILGYDIVIFSTRLNPDFNPGYSQGQLEEILFNALKQQNIPFHGLSAYKPPASYFIDDRAIEFISWDSILNKLQGKEE
jgi:hypothetical protein